MVAGCTMQPLTSYAHTIDVTLDPPLSSSHEASLWLEASDGGGKTESGSDHAGNSPSRPMLVLTRVDGAGGEQRFPLPVGASFLLPRAPYER